MILELNKDYLLKENLCTCCFGKSIFAGHSNGCLIQKGTKISLIKIQRKKLKIYLFKENHGYHIARKRDIIKAIEGENYDT